MMLAMLRISPDDLPEIAFESHLKFIRDTQQLLLDEINFIM